MKALPIFLFTLSLLVGKTAFGDESISLGRGHGCVADDGQVKCWGDNSKFQASPPSVMGSVKMVAAGWYHTCALTEGLSVICWGDNSKKQLQVPSLKNPKEIFAGGYHTCARLEDDTFECWGDNSFGQSAVPGNIGKIINFSAGGYHNCVLTEDHAAFCWGDNREGQAPGKIISGTRSVVTVAAGYGHTCVILDHQSLNAKRGVYCYGLNDLGQSAGLAPDQIPNDNAYYIDKLTAGRDHTCVFAKNKKIGCFGSLYDPDYYPEKKYFPPVRNLTLMASGGLHTCRKGIYDSLYCAGNNDFGQAIAPKGLFEIELISYSTLGNSVDLFGVTKQGDLICVKSSSPDYHREPCSVPDGFQHGIKRIIEMSYGYCLVKSDDSIFCSRSGKMIQIGSPGSKNLEKVYESQGITTLCFDDIFGIKSCWVRDSYWGTYQQVQLPVSIQNADQVISNSSEHAALLKTKELVHYAWNPWGESNPKSLGQFETFLVELGSNPIFCAIKENKKFRCWGNVKYKDFEIDLPPFDGTKYRMFGSPLDKIVVVTDQNEVAWISPFKSENPKFRSVGKIELSEPSGILNYHFNNNKTGLDVIEYFETIDGLIIQNFSIDSPVIFQQFKIPAPFELQKIPR